MLFVCHPKIWPKHCLQFLLELQWPQEKLKTMLQQNFQVTNKEHYGMLRYFLEWSISFVFRYELSMSIWTYCRRPPSIVLLCSGLRELILVSDQLRGQLRPFFTNFRSGRLLELQLYCQPQYKGIGKSPGDEIVISVSPSLDKIL